MKEKKCSRVKNGLKKKVRRHEEKEDKAYRKLERENKKFEREIK